MTSLRHALADYLRIRRRLGFELKATERQLEKFVSFLEQAGAERITGELAVMWARLPVDAHPHRWGQRLSMVRCFARYVATLDRDTEIPSIDLLPARRPRVAPYIYSPAEITALIEAAGQLTPPLRAAGYRTVIGLMATTGLRLGEALGLDRQDVDLDDGALHVRARQTKQREVPLHPTAITALREYARQRDRHRPQPSSPAFFPQPPMESARQARVQPLLRGADPRGRAGGSRRARPPKTTQLEAHDGCADPAGLDPGGRGR
jgi:integrase/recombinase XerD